MKKSKLLASVMMLVLCFGLISCDKDDDKKDEVFSLVGTWREAEDPYELNQVIFNSDKTGVYYTITTSSGSDVIYQEGSFKYKVENEDLYLYIEGDGGYEEGLWKYKIMLLNDNKLVLRGYDDDDNNILTNKMETFFRQ